MKTKKSTRRISKASPRASVRAPKFPACGTCGDHHAPPIPKCDRYNGWKNRETWCVHLWLSNEERTSNFWYSEGAVARAEAEDSAPLWEGNTPRQRATFRLAERMRVTISDEIDEMVSPKGEAGFAMDLLNGALGAVDWFEVAAHFLPDEPA